MPVDVLRFVAFSLVFLLTMVFAFLMHGTYNVYVSEPPEADKPTHRHETCSPAPTPSNSDRNLSSTQLERFVPDVVSEPTVGNAVGLLSRLSGSVDLDSVRSVRDNVMKHSDFIHRGVSYYQQLKDRTVELRKKKDIVLDFRLRQQPMPTDDPDDVVTMLWSGGVASTFRLCELLFVQHRTVRPVFLMSAHLDERKSFLQEQQTVRELYKYLHTHHKDVVRRRLLQIQTVRCNMDCVGGMDTSGPTTCNQIARKELKQALRLPSESGVTPFYIALSRIHEKQDVHDTFLSTGMVEVVLPLSTPHRPLQRAVIEWGTAVHQSLAQQGQVYCTYTVLPDNTLPQHSPKNLFAHRFRHIAFAIPCSSKLDKRTTVRDVVHKKLRHIADTYGFYDVILRTWSCRNPQYTPSERRDIQNQQLRVPRLTTWMYNNSNHRNDRNQSKHHVLPPIQIYPPAWEPCYTCSSCMQRHQDHIWRPAHVDEHMRKLNKDARVHTVNV